jgi:glucose/arabinose dehydrogenase
MMRRWLVLLILPVLLSCTATGTPLPPPPTVDPGQPTSAPPTSIPDTPAPTGMPETDVPSPPPDAASFPNSNEYTWQLIASGLIRPVDLQPDGSGRLFVVEKIGHIHVIEDGLLVDAPFLNIEDRVNDSSNEMGLLGLAFHPNYAQNGFFYVNYTGSGGDTFISRFQVAANNPYLADPSSEVNLLRFNQPFPNHNGGGLDFGPDGYLYAGLGDGGAAGDPLGNGQNTTTLLGAILRLDVDSAEPYAVPADNPFGNEIWAYGLRNPWRIAFDPASGDLFLGDVGQNQWEEIDHLPAGSPGGVNFGWKYREGSHPYDGDAPAGLTDPIAEYSHQEGGCSVTGGYVYRGSMPEWNGIYLYGDYCSGLIWGLIQSGGGWQSQVLFDTDVRITSFGQDEAGEVYLIGDGGEVYQLVRR